MPEVRRREGLSARNRVGWSLAKLIHTSFECKPVSARQIPLTVELLQQLLYDARLYSMESRVEKIGAASVGPRDSHANYHFGLDTGILHCQIKPRRM